MYHSIVERKIRQGFQHMSQGDYEHVLRQFHPNIYFSFAGKHAIGGELHSSVEVRRWFERVYRLFPGIQFEVTKVIVKGLPWDTFITTQFKVAAQLPNGQPYHNTGVQILRLQWGRVVEDRLMEDTQLLIQALQQLAECGNREALADSL